MEINKELPSFNDPDEDLLSQNITDLVQRVKENKPVLIILDGGLGEGKTTLAVKIADKINELNGLNVIDIKGPQYSFGSEEFKKNLIKCYDNKLPAIIYDESGDYDRRRSLTTINFLLNRTFEMFRTFKIIVILCLPNFKTLDERLFENKIPRLLLHVYGKVAQTDKKKGCSHYKGYDIINMTYLRELMNNKKVQLKFKAYDIQTSNFYGRFYDLSPERSKALDELSTAKKKEFITSLTETDHINPDPSDNFKIDIDKIASRGGEFE